MTWGTDYIKNRQHYVFQGYLEKWCADDNKIWCYKKSDNRIFNSSTRDVLNKRQMYRIQEINEDEKRFFEYLMTVLSLTDSEKSEMREHISAYLLPYYNQRVVNELKSINPIPDDHTFNVDLKKLFDSLEELITEQKINSEEDFYSDYEGDGNKWIDKLIAGDTSFYYESQSRIEADVEIQNYEKLDFLNFITIQYFRTVGMRQLLIENLRKMLNLISQNKKKAEENIVFNCDNINLEHVLPHFIWIIQTKCSAGLAKADIQIVRNKTELPFITSDQPVINMKADLSRKEAPDEFVLWYPLSPEVGVVINGCRGERVLDIKKDVDKLNRMIWEHSFEYIVCNKREVLEGMGDMIW